jgi:hypothetical protein
MVHLNLVILAKPIYDDAVHISRVLNIHNFRSSLFLPVAMIKIYGILKCIYILIFTIA